MKIGRKFQTYLTVGYTYQISGSDPRSTGGVHHHQIRKTSCGRYLVRIVQTNGRYSSVSDGIEATPEQVEKALQG